MRTLVCCNLLKTIRGSAPEHYQNSMKFTQNFMAMLCNRYRVQCFQINIEPAMVNSYSASTFRENRMDNVQGICVAKEHG